MESPELDLRLKCLWIACGFAVTVVVAYFAFDKAGLQSIEAAYNEPVAMTLYAYMTDPEPVDIVIIGSSRVDYGLHSAAIEQRLEREWNRKLRVFKLSFGGLRPYLMSTILKDVVMRKPPRELLVIGIEERLFTRSVRDVGRWGERRPELGKDGDLLAGEWDRDESVARTPEILRGVKNFWYLEWMLRDRTKRLSDFRRENGGQELSLDDYQKRDDRHRKWTEQKGQKPYTPRGTRWEWGEDNADGEGFVRLLSLLEDFDVPVAFIAMPIREDLQEELEPFREQFKERVVPLIRKRGYRFYDLNRWKDVVQDIDFLDPHHLFISGARKASVRFVDDVVIPELEHVKEAQGG